MKRCALAVLTIILFTLQGFCQENQVSNNQNASQVTSETASPSQAKNSEIENPQEISIYGKITSVNIATSSVVVQYYDYDSDNEKSVEITVDNSTKMEGILNINGIKEGNWADIDYGVANGKNMAKSIAIEGEDTPPDAAAS